MLIRRARGVGRWLLAFSLLAVRPVTDAQAARVTQAKALQPTAAAEVAVPSPQDRSAVAVASEQSAAEEPSSPTPRYFTVRKGDSLSRIGKRFGVTAGALAQANGLRSRSLLRIGVKLRIPSGTLGEAQLSRKEPPRGLGGSALMYRGVPYRYAGTSSRGMDCSGLVSRVLQLHGIRAPHNSKALYKLGKPVAKRNLKPDDLVFFNTRGHGISHVGIYLGDGRFVHASSGSGRVQTDTLSDGYYAKHYVGARRL